MKNEKNRLVECVTATGSRFEGELIRLGRFDAMLTVSHCFDGLRTSEVLSECCIMSGRGS